jgi:hypothetical protein
MKNKIKLSIIIVSYNSKNNLEKCIQSIYQKMGDLLEWEVIVVNNDERENLSEMKVDFEKVKIIDHKKNVGFGAGMNLGVKNSQGEFLLILNPDTEIEIDNVDQVIKRFENDKTIGIIGGGIFNRNGEKQEWSAGKEISFYDLVRNNLGISRSLKVWNSSEEMECDWVAGTVLFIKKSLFEKLGGFDDDSFFMYFEDMDLCKRAKTLGKKIIFYPDFKVYHGSGESYEDQRLQKKHYYDSMENYLQKHSKWFSLIVARFIRKNFIKK